jgi:hypothetical protein
MKNEGAGKGDTYRKVDRSKFEENYDRIFGKSKKQTNQSAVSGRRRTTSHGSQEKSDWNGFDPSVHREGSD